LGAGREYLQHDYRAVLSLGSTEEQHSHLRLTVDCIRPERVAADSAEPLGVPVFPVVQYGVTPYLREFPGSISLRVETHLRVESDIVDCMGHSDFAGFSSSKDTAATTPFSSSRNSSARQPPSRPLVTSS
jgi:creatinine amidohydrolase/Fe(II)-dependent formamide hydrolase-like protein